MDAFDYSREKVREQRIQLAEEREDTIDMQRKAIMSLNERIVELEEERRTLRFELNELRANANRLEVYDQWVVKDDGLPTFCGCDGDKLLQYEVVGARCLKCGREGGATWG